MFWNQDVMRIVCFHNQCNDRRDGKQRERSSDQRSRQKLTPGKNQNERQKIQAQRDHPKKWKRCNVGGDVRRHAQHQA